MTIQSKHENFNIAYDEVMRKFFIVSKLDEDNRPTIGGFDLASEAIDFEIKRVS